jgi:GTPase SAR1 family protein
MYYKQEEVEKITIMIFGEKAIGKSSLLSQFIDCNLDATSGIDFR